MDVPHLQVQEHALGLTVTRLSKPNLMTTPISMGEQWDHLGRVLEAEFTKDATATPTLPGLPISSMLELPLLNTPGKGNQIFLGETYRVYVSLCNDIHEPVNDVVLKVEVVTSSHNRVLLHQTPPLSIMSPNERIDRILNHDVKDMGEHNLVCTVSYTLPSGEEKLLRRLQQFNVSKPLEVRPDFQMVENNVLLTVQIQNVMPHSVFLDVVSFDPAAGFISVDLNTTTEGCSVFGKDDIFSPHTNRQYLFHITPQMPVHQSGSGTRAVSVSVGKMDIVWRGRFGERGRIQTGQLKAVIPPPHELQVTLRESPGIVQLERQFSINITLSNNTNREMRLRYQLERQPGAGTLWCGITNETLQELGPQESLDITLNLLPILPGIQAISNVMFIDMLNNQKRYPILKLGSVFVSHDPTKPHPHLINSPNTSIIVNTNV